MCNKTQEYFSKVIDPEAFALYMRRLLYVTNILHLRDENNDYKEWIEDGYFYLNDFIETIDPQLEK